MVGDFIQVPLQGGMLHLVGTSALLRVTKSITLASSRLLSLLPLPARMQPPFRVSQILVALGEGLPRETWTCTGYPSSAVQKKMARPWKRYSLGIIP